MRYSFKPFFSRAMALLGLVGLGVVQTGCAHPVVFEPSVSVHSRIGHDPVYAQVGVPGPVYYAPPRVIYIPPPPRVVYVPRVHVPWGHPPAQIRGRGHGHDRGHRGHERRQYLEDERVRGGGWRWQHDQWRH